MSGDARLDASEARVRALTGQVADRERRLELLSAIALRTHALRDAREILDVALSEILSRFGLTAGWVFTGSQEDRKLHFAASRGVSADYLATVEREGLEDCLCPEVFRSGHRMEARNTTECPRMPTIVEGLTEPVAHACIPLRFEGLRRGVLNVAARPGERFSEDELRFLEVLGHQICVALERAAHIEAEGQRNDEARALAAINKAIGGSLEPRAVLAAIGRSARELLAADRVQVLLGSDAESLVVAHLSGLPHPELREDDVIDLAALGARGQRSALESRTALIAHDWAHDPRVDEALAGRWGIAAGIVLPLVAHERTLGLLIVTRERALPFTSAQVVVAEALADQAAIALENARLYEASRAALDDLKAAQERMLQNQKLAVLGTFASGLAHEIRNPLNSMGLQLAILERRIKRLEGGAAAELEQLAAIIRGEIGRLDRLAGDFLLLSRGQRSRHRPTPFDAVADDVAGLLEPEALAAGVRLERRRGASGQLAIAAMDAEKMKQVAINLVRNAIEAVGRGGTVSLDTEVVDKEARLLVHDDGPGLPDGVDVFQVFVTTKAQGTGLGLPIAQQIVAEHGGRIAGGNRPGGGATFTVALPLTTSREES